MSFARELVNDNDRPDSSAVRIESDTCRPDSIVPRDWPPPSKRSCASVTLELLLFSTVTFMPRETIASHSGNIRSSANTVNQCLYEHEFLMGMAGKPGFVWRGQADNLIIYRNSQRSWITDRGDVQDYRIIGLTPARRCRHRQRSARHA